MLKKKWIIVTVLAITVVAAIGVGIGVYADTPTPTTTTPAKVVPVDPQKALADKVAGILGLDTAKVEAAFTQDQKELATERAAAALKAEEARIDQMVADGKMTADDAAKYKAWLEARPNVNAPAPGFCAPNNKMGPGMMNKGVMPFNRSQVKPPVTPTATN
jgi:hypothetical protein